MVTRAGSVVTGLLALLCTAGVASGTVSGGVNILAGQTTRQALITWTGNSNVCHQGADAITGRGPADSWRVSEFLWSCQVRGTSIWAWNPTGGPFGTGGLLNSSIGVGSTVDFAKNDVQGLVTAFPPGRGTPAEAAFPTDVTRAQWLVNGVVLQDGAPAAGARITNFGGNVVDGSPAEYYWYRTRLLSFSHTFTEPGASTVGLVVDYANGSRESVSGVVTVVGGSMPPAAGGGTPAGGAVSPPRPAGTDLAAGAPQAVAGATPRFPVRVVQRALRARLDCVHDRIRCLAFFLSPATVPPVRAAWASGATLSLRCEGACPGSDQRRGQVIRLATGGAFSPRLWGARDRDGRPDASRAFRVGARLVSTLTAPGIRLTAVLPITTSTLPFRRPVVERALRWTEACALSGSAWACPEGTTPERGSAA